MADYRLTHFTLHTGPGGEPTCLPACRLSLTYQTFSLISPLYLFGTSCGHVPCAACCIALLLRLPAVLPLPLPSDMFPSPLRTLEFRKEGGRAGMLLHLCLYI